MQPDQKTILISKYKSVVLGQLQTSTIHWCLAMTKHQTGRCSNFCLAWVLWLGCCLPKIKYLAAWQDNNQMNCEKVSTQTKWPKKKLNKNLKKYSFFQLPFSMWLPRYHVNHFQQRVPFFHVNKNQSNNKMKHCGTSCVHILLHLTLELFHSCHRYCW